MILMTIYETSGRSSHCQCKGWYKVSEIKGNLASLDLSLFNRKESTTVFLA